MGLLPMTFASGFASGLNAYATVFILGLCGRFLHTQGVPEGFQRVDVLVIMGVLALLELVANKIPYIDSAWDTVSTIIRPIAGAVIGALIAGAHGDLLTITLAAVGGVTALLSHLSQASIRLAVNTSPEPVTNIAASVTNDVVMGSAAVTAALAPIPAMIITALVLLGMIIIAVLLMRRAIRGWRRFQAWWARRRGTPPPPPPQRYAGSY